MKFTVTRAFIDSQTNRPYAIGDEYETADEGRAANLQKRGFLFQTTAAANEKKKPKTASE